MLFGLMTTIVIASIGCFAPQPMLAEVSADSQRALGTGGLRSHLRETAKTEEGANRDAEFRV